MKRYLQFVVALLAILVLLPASPAQRRGETDDPFSRPDIKLPSGKSQRDEIVRADHKRNQEDATKLAMLAAELKDELAESDSHVVSVKTLKKLDDMERLVRGIRGRLKRN
jgi:hypothetical protein